MNNLNTYGYIVLRNVVDVNRIHYAQNQINSKVNYYKLKKYLDNDMINNVNRKLGLHLDYTKYRVSNNNNSTDAASFHRDLQSYTNKLPRVFTVLSYLDISHMELVPYTHKNITIPVTSMKNMLDNRITIKMNPGDILIFYATLVHRGIFYNSNNKNRRLIQLFDCVDINDKDKYREEILHIPCRNNCSSLVNYINLTLNKSYIISEILNYISTIITFRGYGYSYYGLKYITNDKKIKYLSTEANKNRLYNGKNKDKFLKINLYVMNFKHYKDIDSNKRNAYQFFTFGITTIIFFIILIILFIILYKLIRLIYKYKNAKNKKLFFKKNFRILS